MRFYSRASPQHELLAQRGAGLRVARAWCRAGRLRTAESTCCARPVLARARARVLPRLDHLVLRVLGVQGAAGRVERAGAVEAVHRRTALAAAREGHSRPAQLQRGGVQLVGEEPVVRRATTRYRRRRRFGFRHPPPPHKPARCPSVASVAGHNAVHREACNAARRGTRHRKQRALEGEQRHLPCAAGAQVHGHEDVWRRPRR